MKTLLLLRHGKAEAEAPHGDHARALKKRGRSDAEEVGKNLKSLACSPDLIVTSDATRADETANLAAEAAGYKKKIAVEPDIYGAGLDTLLKVVRKLPDSADCVLLVGHNPGFEDLGSALSEDGTIDSHLATAGLVHLEFKTNHWKDVREGTGKLRGVYNPTDHS